VTLELGGKNAALFLDDLTPEAMVFQQRQHRIQFTLRQIKALRGGANLPLVQVAGFQAVGQCVR
jgi:hypothetical protein